MTYNKFWKTFVTVAIYLLTAAGALIMILPFAWMIITSFKSEGEVNDWPPKWTSKNFYSSRQLNVQTSRSNVSGKGNFNLAEFRTVSSEDPFESNKLVYYINDDPVYRGKFELKFDTIDYSSSESLGIILQQMDDYISNTQVRDDLAAFFAVGENTPGFFEELYFNLFSPDDGYYKKIVMARLISSDISKMITYINRLNEGNIDKLVAFRISDSMSSQEITEVMAKKEVFSSDMAVLKEKLTEIKNILDNNYKGSEMLSTDDASALKTLLLDFASLINAYDDPILSKNNQIMLNQFYNPVVKNVNTLEFLTYFTNSFKKVQSEKFSGQSIIFKVAQKDKMYENFAADIKQADFPDFFKDEVSRLLTKDNILEIKDIVILQMEKEMSDNIRIKLSSQPSDLSACISLVRDIAKLSPDENEFENYLGENELKLYESFDDNKKEDLFELAQKRREYDSIFSRFGKFYADSVSTADILQAPSFVKTIRYKNNSIIEIITDNVLSTWFLEEKPFVKATFTFGEVFKNIFQSYVIAWNAAPFSRYYLNTIFMALLTTFFEIILAAMAAFAFAKLEFYGKNIIFSLFLSTMMIPGEVMLVPNYITISKFQWVDSYYALIVPWVVSVFAIFLLRQQFLSLPNDLWDAAKIDGSSSWRFLWTVMVPLSKPSILTGGLLKFVGSWNAFLWVLIVTKSPEMRTLAVGLQTFTTDAGTKYNLLMAASTFSILPVVIIFIFLQRYFVEGIARSGLKG
jgi:multiple sugar transport system permease protein